MGTLYTFHAATLVQNCVVVVQAVYVLIFVRCLSDRFYNGRVRLLYRRKIVGPNTVVEPRSTPLFFTARSARSVITCTQYSCV